MSTYGLIGKEQGMSKDFTDLPDDVLWVMVIRHTQPYVGKDMMNKMLDIIDKYPQYFQWEHKYKAIPDEVHDAFKKECYPEMYNPDRFTPRKGNGLYSEIKKYEIKPVTMEDMEQLFLEIDKKEQERHEKEKRIKRIWNKHYSKYGLEYRK